MRPVLGHQEPAREPCLDKVKPGASRRLRELRHADKQIAIEHQLQGWALSELLPKRGGIHPQRRTGTLHERLQRRRGNAEHDGRPHHAFIPDQSDFERAEPSTGVTSEMKPAIGK